MNLDRQNYRNYYFENTGYRKFGFSELNKLEFAEMHYMDLIEALENTFARYKVVGQLPICREQKLSACRDDLLDKKLEIS